MVDISCGVGRVRSPSRAPCRREFLPFLPLQRRGWMDPSARPFPSCCSSFGAVAIVVAGVPSCAFAPVYRGNTRGRLWFPPILSTQAWRQSFFLFSVVLFVASTSRQRDGGGVPFYVYKELVRGVWCGVVVCARRRDSPVCTNARVSCASGWKRKPPAFLFLSVFFAAAVVQLRQWVGLKPSRDA